MLLAFYADAQFAQAIHPAPNGRSGDTDFSRDAGAADDDGGVFREQRKQRGDPPIGCSRNCLLWLAFGHEKRSSVILIAWNREFDDLGFTGSAGAIFAADTEQKRSGPAPL
jgi:hypothetical protein